MSFADFEHNPTKVQAIQVARPWIHVQNQVPTASQIKTASGAFSCFRVASAGSLNVARAYEGDWIIKWGGGVYTVQKRDEFQYNYGKDEAGE